MLDNLGRQIAGEWAKDNGIRKIDTPALQVWGARLKEAKRQDSGDGLRIRAALQAVQREVNQKLAH